jgi:hypothetical protein
MVFKTLSKSLPTVVLASFVNICGISNAIAEPANTEKPPQTAEEIALLDGLQAQTSKNELNLRDLFFMTLVYKQIAEKDRITSKMCDGMKKKDPVRLSKEAQNSISDSYALLVEFGRMTKEQSAEVKPRIDWLTATIATNMVIINTICDRKFTI